MKRLRVNPIRGFLCVRLYQKWKGNLKQFNLTAAHDFKSLLSNLKGILNHYVYVMSEKVPDQKSGESVNVENSLNRMKEDDLKWFLKKPDQIMITL